MNTSNFIFFFHLTSLLSSTLLWFSFPVVHTVLSVFGSSLLFEYCRFLERKLYFCQFVFLFVSVCLFYRPLTLHIHMYLSLSFLILISPQYSFSSIFLVGSPLSWWRPNMLFTKHRLLIIYSTTVKALKKKIFVANYIKAVLMGNLFLNNVTIRSFYFILFFLNQNRAHKAITIPIRVTAFTWTNTFAQNQTILQN